MATTTVEVAAGKAFLPPVRRDRYTSACHLKTGLAILGFDRFQTSHDDVAAADVQSWAAAGVVDPDELAVSE